jgi:hypothetical protein
LKHCTCSDVGRVQKPNIAFYWQHFTKILGASIIRCRRNQLWGAHTSTQSWQATNHAMMSPNIWRHYSWIGGRRENGSSWIFSKRPLSLSDKTGCRLDSHCHLPFRLPLLAGHMRRY